MCSPNIGAEQNSDASIDSTLAIGAPAGGPEEVAAAAGRQVLPPIRSALGAGDWDSARQQMLQLAIFVGQSHDLRGLEALKEILTEGEPSTLLAMSLLLFDVSREALGSRQFLVSTVTRQAAFACLDRLESTPGVPTALVADAYTLIGAQLQSSGSSSASGDSFRRAVKLDPQLGPARLGLGIYLDQLGNTAEAVDVFGQLPPIQPHHGEASLRRAVALIHLDRERPAQRALEALVDPNAASPPEPWVQSVAYQELAMMRLRDEGPRAALDVLETSVQRLPDDQRLRLLLAFVHSTLGRRAAAASVLDAVETRPDQVGELSPRRRLAEWHLEVPTGLAERLREHAEASIATGTLTP
ncbi:MAG: hypothetical protein MPN21_07770 [Thermoanaerobaculia bacterium]|nr:hypothetical protein [Thermoanaerobaculia bacterium]